MVGRSETDESLERARDKIVTAADALQASVCQHAGVTRPSNSSALRFPDLPAVAGVRQPTDMPLRRSTRLKNSTSRGRLPQARGVVLNLTEPPVSGSSPGLRHPDDERILFASVGSLE